MRFSNWPSAFSILGGDAITHCGFFGLARRGAAQNVGFVSGGCRHPLHFDIGPDLLPLAVEQLLFKLLQLRARRTHQILSVPFPKCLEIVLADDAPVKDPHAARFAVLALDHPDHRFQRRDIGPGLRKQVSSAGVELVWRKDGREILYVDEGSVWSVAVQSAENGLHFAMPQKLFSGLGRQRALTMHPVISGVA
jgi:hypothetical protein